MSQYYLISQLPGLDGLDSRAALPISREEFLEVCSRFLNKKDMRILENLSLVPAREDQPSGSSLVDTFNRRERKLRIALGIARASKMKKTFHAEENGMDPETTQAAKNAVEAKDPLEAELYLNQNRLDYLNSLRPMDAFSEDAVYFYGLKLMLLERMQKFDKEKGIASYQKLYESILNGDRQEM